LKSYSLCIVLENIMLTKLYLSNLQSVFVYRFFAHVTRPTCEEREKKIKAKTYIHQEKGREVTHSYIIKV
jgi:hypothetical protein